MRKGFKKFLTVATAAVMAAGAFSLAACGSNFQTPTDIPEGETVSNGGFAVQKGDYVYFINGVESYTSDNTYGTPVRGSLMRIKTADVANKENNAETVIPSLMVGGDYVAGISIFGDRIYYVSPNTVKDMSGTVQTNYLNFMSAKLNGTDIKEHLRVSGNSTVYRTVEVGGSVYFVYLEDSDIYSLNTKTGTKTLLAASVTGNTLGGAQANPEWIYYTMEVTDNLASSNPIACRYNQIYRVRADWTETSTPGATDSSAPYTYEFDEEYVKNELDGEVPYHNLGELVLDGRGSTDKKIQYNHSDATPDTPYGYTYTLRSSEGDGIYFTRAQVSNTGSSGTYLYYLSEETIDGATFDSVTANKTLDLVSTETANASASALYYIENGTHFYIYTDGSSIYRVKMNSEGDRPVAEEQEIAHGLSSPTLRSIDDTSDATYKYVYYICTDGGGVSVNRAVYNGTAKDYEDLQFEEHNKKPFEAVKVLDVQHNSAWYPFEIIDNVLYYADASTTVNSTSYNYICTVSLKNAENKLMNNEELAAFNDKYDELMGTDDGYFAKLNKDGNTKLSAALRYYFYTGERKAFDENIKAAVEEGKKSETYLYSEEEQKAFDDFVKAEGETAGKFVDGTTSYRTRSYFVTSIGKMAEDDIEEMENYWTTALEHYTLPETEEEVLPAWAWALIGVGIAIVVAGGVVAAVLVIRSKKKKQEKPEKNLMRVDTSDDKELDVYATRPEEEPEAPAEPAEAPAETTEAPAEAPAETTEAPAETPAETTDKPDGE